MFNLPLLLPSLSMLPIRTATIAILLLGPALCSLLVPSISHASTVNVSNGRHLFASPLELGGAMEILIDRSGDLDIDDVRRQDVDEMFIPFTQPTFNPGFSSDVFWARFSLSNKLSTADRFILEINTPLMDEIELYQVGEAGDISLQHGGEIVAFADRTAYHRNAIFPVSLPQGTVQQFYVRFHNRGSVPFQPRLWLPPTFRTHSEKEMFALGIYYGAIITILFYNLVLYLMVRRRTYLAYLFYVLAYLFWQLTYNGLAAQYFWPAAPWLNHYAISLFISASGICALQFSRLFLSTDRYIPAFDRFIKLVIAGFVCSLLFSLQPHYSLSMFLAATMAIIFSPTLLIASILCLKKGYRPARYFVIAWFCLICGTAILGMKSFGLLPSTPVTEYAQQAGSFLEILLLSLALADQVNLMKREKEMAQEQALQIQKEATEHLEKKVAERTLDLQTSNRNLQVLSSKLAKYLSPQVYYSIFSGKTEVKQSSYRKKLTVFFSDIKDFTQLTDSMEPESLNALLNYYLNSMTEIALKYGGTIDKFVGDAILVFFGDPESQGEKEDALNCVKMALEMQGFMRRFNQEQNPCNITRELKIRIGINSGFCTVGNFGSENRLDYTIIGGQVNLASRLEHSCEPDGILISANTYELVKDQVGCAEKGEIKVKGIAYPVKTYGVSDLVDSPGPASATAIQVDGSGFSIALDPLRIEEQDRGKIRQTLHQAMQLLTAEQEGQTEG